MADSPSLKSLDLPQVEEYTPPMVPEGHSERETGEPPKMWRQRESGWSGASSQRSVSPDATGPSESSSRSAHRRETPDGDLGDLHVPHPALRKFQVPIYGIESEEWGRASQRIAARYLSDAGPLGSKYRHPSTRLERQAVKEATDFVRRQLRRVRIDDLAIEGGKLTEMNHTLIQNPLVKADGMSNQHLVRLLVDIRNRDGSSIVPFGDHTGKNRWQEHSDSPVHLQVDIEIPSAALNTSGRNRHANRRLSLASDARAATDDLQRDAYGQLVFRYSLNILYSEEAFVNELAAHQDGPIDLPAFHAHTGTFVKDTLAHAISSIFGERAASNIEDFFVRKMAHNVPEALELLDSPKPAEVFCVFEVVNSENVSERTFVRLTLDLDDSSLRWDRIDNRTFQKQFLERQIRFD